MAGEGASLLKLFIFKNNFYDTHKKNFFHHKNIKKLDCFS